MSSDGLWQAWGKGVEPPSRNNTGVWIYARSPAAESAESITSELLTRSGDTILVHRLPRGHAFDIKSQQLRNTPQGLALLNLKTRKLTLLKAERVPLSTENIDRLAKEVGYVSGKWLVYRSAVDIDSLWMMIAEATTEGRLGTSAKVSTALASQGKQHVVCVYTADYFDDGDVKRVRDVLRGLDVSEPLYYKPDIYTQLGIYSGNAPIRPWRYRD